jgi:hypothetical protein
LNIMRIIRGLSSRQLACGCLAGIYETYGGAIVVIVDARGPECTAPDHAEGQVLPGIPADETASRGPGD